jgi:hypothetical protein
MKFRITLSASQLKALLILLKREPFPPVRVIDLCVALRDMLSADLITDYKTDGLKGDDEL